MRIVLAAGALSAFLVAPYVLRGPLLSFGSPRWFAWLGAVTLLGIAASFVTLLGTVVAPEPVPILAFPELLEACLDAAAKLVSHPLAHWPSIVAAVLLAAVAIRLLVSLVNTVRDARRARPPGDGLRAGRTGPGRPAPAACADPIVLATREPVAYTTGVIRARAVVSRGLLMELDAPSRAAVVAHERAHAERRHVAALFAARVLERALGFIPSIRLSVRYLVLAFETAADDSAAEAVGDRLLVARAITCVARMRTGGPAVALDVAGDEIAYRVRRLAAPARPATGRSLLAGAVALSVAAVLLLAVAWSAAGAALSRERLALALDGTCRAQQGPARPA